MKLRTPQEVKDELKRNGLSITQWATARGYATNMVFEVLAGRKKGIRGQAHEIAVALGLKDGVICKDPAKALEKRAA